MNSEILQQHTAAAQEALASFLATLLSPDAVLHVDAPVPTTFKEARLQTRAYVVGLSTAAEAPCAVLLEAGWVALCANAMLGEPLDITDDGAEDLMRETVAQGYGAVRNHLAANDLALPDTTFDILPPGEALAEGALPDDLMEVSFGVKMGETSTGGIVLMAVPNEEPAAAEAPAPPEAAQKPAQPVTVAAASFPELGDESISGDGDNFTLLAEVELDVTVELGRRRLPLSDVLRLTTGSVIELEKLVGEPLDIYANGRLIAEGEAVVIDEQFGIRITGLAAQRQRTKAFL